MEEESSLSAAHEIDQRRERIRAQSAGRSGVGAGATTSKYTNYQQVGDVHFDYFSAIFE